MMKAREGEAEIFVPDQSITRKAEAFYNPAMEYQRDLTVSALRVYQKTSGKKLSVCDPLAGTGVRSIRIAKEAGNIENILVNDANPKAFAIIKKNVKRNGLEDVEVSNKNANVLFLERTREFDYVDIDPFGSPLNFIFNAGYALKPRSFLACTATDTGALCGSFPSACFTRYGIRVVKTDFFKETGVRTLTTAIMLELSKHGMAFEPVYSHANHYFRVMGLVRRSKSALSAQAKQIKFFVYCRACLYRSFTMTGTCPECGERIHILGPLWTGKIKENGFCKKMLDDLRSRNYRETKEINACLHEIDEPFYYDLHRIFKLLKRTPRRIDDVTGNLKKRGYKVSRTHLCGTGIKTDAPYEKVLAAASGRTS